MNITFNPWSKRNSMKNNIWIFECFYPDGSLKWKEVVNNIVVDEGLYHSLDVIFMAGTAYSNWYVALFNTDSTPAAGWDYAGINTDQTEFTSYDEATRQQWSPSAIVTLSLSDEVSFTASTGVNTTLYGAFLVNVSTKGDSASGSGIMWCATRFGTPRPYVATEVLNVTYAINSQDV
jgi:hypothetical protein